VHEIEAVRPLFARKIPVLSHTFVKIGQRVRIRGGSLDGVEGILVGRKGDKQATPVGQSHSTICGRFARRLHHGTGISVSLAFVPHVICQLT
jgi:hypothetical protein